VKANRNFEGIVWFYTFPVTVALFFNVSFSSPRSTQTTLSVHLPYKSFNMILESILLIILFTIAAYLIKAIRAQRARRPDLSRPRQRQRQVYTPQDGITTSYTLGKATTSL
jgi:hypothetical protein